MFSYEDYRKIIEIIKSTGLQAGYKEAINRDKFILMRHDVEYSVERAYHLSKVEESMDFTSTYFFPHSCTTGQKEAETEMFLYISDSHQ